MRRATPLIALLLVSACSVTTGNGDSTAAISVTAAAKDLVRLFKRTGEGATDFEVLADDSTFTADEIRAGVELAIEAKDIVRDTAKWDGYVDVTLTVTVGADSATDTVK